MEQTLGPIAFWLSAALFSAAFIAMIVIGIQKLVKSQREGRPALMPPLSTEMTKKDYQKIFWWLLLTTALVYAAGVIAVIVKTNYTLSLHDAFLYAFQKSDALHYIEVAKYGYTAIGETRYFIVFFPLFPLLVRIFAVFTFGHYILASVILNFVLMYVALIAIFKIGIMDFTRDIVWYGIGLMLLYPLAFFFHNAYSEPLFLMTSALSLYYTRRDKYALAGLMGFFCALSRASGVLCAVPLVARSFIRAWENKKFHPVQWLKNAAWSVVTLLGTGSYFLLNYVVTGDPTMFLTIQNDHWYNHFALFPNAVQTVTERMITNIYPHHAAMWISQFIALFLFLILLILGARKLSTELSFYNCAFYLMMISQSWLLSGPRYLMTMFPAFFVLSLVLKTRFTRIAGLSVFGAGLVLMTALFAIGHCIY